MGFLSRTGDLLSTVDDILSFSSGRGLKRSVRDIGVVWELDVVAKCCDAWISVVSNGTLMLSMTFRPLLSAEASLRQHSGDVMCQKGPFSITEYCSRVSFLKIVHLYLNCLSL